MKKFIFIVISILLILVFILSPLVMAQTPAATTITIKGQLVNATSGGSVGEGIPLMLHVYDGEQMADMIHDVTTGPEGVFRYEDIEVVEGRTFEVMASVGRTIYFSESASASPGQTVLELPITIYDATTDTSAIRIKQMHMLVEPIGLSQVQVMEIYIISNNSDRTVEEAVTLDNGQTASLRFMLPEGAAGLSFSGNNENGRFTHTTDGFADTWGVPPGREAAQISVSYLLSYQDGLRVERTLSYPIDGLSVMLPQVGVSLNSEALTPLPPRQMQDGRIMEIFTAEGFQAGQTLSFELSGQPQVDGQPETSLTGASPASASQLTTNQMLILAGLVVFALALIGGGVQWWRRTAESPVYVPDLETALSIDPDTPEASLIRAIAELDDAYETGIIPEENYTHQRSALRTELKALLTDNRQTDSAKTVNHNGQEVKVAAETGLESS